MLDINEYKNKEILVLGGLGFIGSNISHRLVELGAKVHILDSLNPLYGGNLFNINGIKDRVSLTIGDIRDEKILAQTIPGKDYIFSFAAQVSPIDSDLMPREDLYVNLLGHQKILEACRNYNKNTKILFSSSRMVYGRTKDVSITEESSTSPINIYAVHKLCVEKYYLNYFKNHGIKSVIARLTNPYGIRQQIKHSKYSIPGWFMRLAMEDQLIKIFGDGTQIRDYIYIDDLVEGLLLLMLSENSSGEIFNIGSGVHTKFKDMVESVISAVGKGEIEYVPWPDNYKNIETGDAPVSIEKIKKLTGWKPKTSIIEGMNKMVEYYRAHKDKYTNT